MGRSRFGHRPTEAKTHFDKFETIRGRKVRTDTVVEIVQRCLRMRLQRDAWARPRIGNAHAQRRSRG